MKSRIFAMPPVSSGTLALLNAIIGFLVILVGVSLVLVPARERVTALLACLPGVLIGGGTLIWVHQAMQRSQVEVTERELRVKGAFGKSFPLDEFRLNEARVVNLETETNYQPMVRTFGASVGAYNFGWFVLKNKQNAYLGLTEMRPVVLLPKREGSLVLVSVTDPEAFLTHIKNRVV